MPLSRIFKKASNFILRSQPEDSSSPSYSDGEVVFCKNNVCVHPPALVRQETDILHHPGYLTVTCQVVDERRTLFLSWIPNTTLRKHPCTVEQRSLSVTRVRDSQTKEGETRRLSASSILLGDHKRRNSSDSFDTECSGCFPENYVSTLSPQLQAKIRHEGRDYRSCSLSSNSDNNSLILTPTESLKDSISSSLIINNSDKINNEENESENLSNSKPLLPCIKKTDEKSVTNNCDDLVEKDISCGSINSVDNCSNISSDFNLKNDSSELQKEISSNSNEEFLDNKEQNDNDDDDDNDDKKLPIILTSNIDQNNVPNDEISINILTNNTEENNLESSFDNESKSSIKNDDNEVPNIKLINNSSCNNNVISTNSSNNEILNDSDDNSDKEINENNKVLPNELEDKVINSTQCTFTKSDGIVYIDNLVLQEYPHILSSDNLKTVNNSDNNVKEFVKKRNFENLKVVDDTPTKSLPLRSYEDSFAPSWMSSPELLALKHNLNFPESVTASPVVRRAQRCCRKFRVDLSEMRSLRLFFSDAESTKGQLVIASRECQYKILHFHHSGLERLASILQQWHLLTIVPHGDNLPYRHFMVCKPAVHDNELHPEEGKVGLVTMADWLEMLNPLGQVEDDIALRKGIFLGGLDSSLRKIVWPFLLHCFSYQSTTAERELILAIRRQEYEEITNRRLSLEGAAKERFLRNIQCVVEKDVIRTDRGNPYYAGESNPHLDTMKSILLNYAVYDAGLGYLQGMSDLLAPLLAEIGTEADAFWCFVGLMRRTIFVCTPTDSDMERNLSYLRELIREMVPEFYKHLQCHTDAMELLFCHRWILLCFKREFPEEMALKMWEACWANYLTDYFNLFLCLAIVSAYADDVIAQDLRTDEMLLHFSSLAMFMDGELILRKARGLLYQFRQRPVIPCTLAGLCMQCGPGIWDSGHAPTVECRGSNYCQQNPCPYRGTSSTSS